MANPNKNYLYTWNVAFFIPDKDEAIPVHVESVPKFLLDYQENIFPVIKMRFSLSLQNASILLKRKKQMYASVELIVTETEELSDDSETSRPDEVEERIIHRSMYLPILIEKTIPGYVSESMANTAETQEAGEDEEYPNTSRPQQSISPTIEAMFYNTEGLRLNKESMYNFVSEGDIATSLVYIISQLPDFVKSIIVDPPSNEQTYVEIRSPLYNLRNTLESLQKRYGVYDSGLLLFYIFNTLYILNRHGAEHEYMDGDYSRVELNVRDIETDPTSPSATVIRVKDEDTLEYEVGSIIRPLDHSVVMGERFGDSIIFSNLDLVGSAVSYNDPEKDVKANYKNPGVMIRRHDSTHEMSGNKTRYEYDNLNNPVNVVSAMKDNAPGTLVMVNIPTADILSFLPNKIYSIRVTNDEAKDQKFRGTYRIFHAMLSFDKLEPAGFKMACNAQLLLAKNE